MTSRRHHSLTPLLEARRNPGLSLVFERDTREASLAARGHNEVGKVMIWGRFSGEAYDDADAGAPADTDAFNAEEGLELLALFQTIRQRADRRAALDLIRRVAARSRMTESIAIKPHA